MRTKRNRTMVSIFDLGLEMWQRIGAKSRITVWKHSEMCIDRHIILKSIEI